MEQEISTYTMTASPSRSPLLDGFRSLLRNQWLVVLAIFVLTMAIRWVFHLWHPHPTGFFIYNGSPISDGSTYTFKAINIANGQGIPPAQQPAIRPLYSIVLACLYTWTGFSLVAVTALNIIIGGATAALIYLCGAVAFNRLCGLGAALFFAIDPTQLIQTPQAASEPLGLLFFVGSVYAVILAFKKQQAGMFFLSGLLIGLSNLTRTLTAFTLPFYIGLALFAGWRHRRFKAAAWYALSILIGFTLVILPWLIRQERLFGIASLSDNVGEAIYAAASTHYGRRTPAVRKDADAAGIPNTIGDRYRFFIDRAFDNVKTNPGFYLRNVGTALWEYANSFGLQSRAIGRYANSQSSADQGQKVFLYYLVVFTLLVWLLRRDTPFAPSNLIFLLISIGLVVLYGAVPPWAAFVPIVTGIILNCRPRRTMPNLIMSGTLVTTVLGSAIFANPVLFRSVLMTDWLFVLYFLAGVWFPAEILSRRFAAQPDLANVGPTNQHEASSFHNALSSASRLSCLLFVVVVIGFFLVSGARLIAISISPHREKQRTQSAMGWILRRGLTPSEKLRILHRLHEAPFLLLPTDPRQVRIFDGGKNPPRVGDYVVDVEGFYYDYDIPPHETLPYPMVLPKPYPRTLIRLSRYDFLFPGEVPEDLTNRQLAFVGVIVPKEVEDQEQASRPLVRGVAILPMRDNRRADFAHAICAPRDEPTP